MTSEEVFIWFCTHKTIYGKYTAAHRSRRNGGVWVANRRTSENVERRNPMQEDVGGGWMMFLSHNLGWLPMRCTMGYQPDNRLRCHNSLLSSDQRWDEVSFVWGGKEEAKIKVFLVPQKQKIRLFFSTTAQPHLLKFQSEEKA